MVGAERWSGRLPIGAGRLERGGGGGVSRNSAWSRLGWPPCGLPVQRVTWVLSDLPFAWEGACRNQGPEREAACPPRAQSPAGPPRPLWQLKKPEARAGTARPPQQLPARPEPPAQMPPVPALRRAKLLQSSTRNPWEARSMPESLRTVPRRGRQEKPF
ncbi:hypothetical protein P7K49_032924 [Saguinus oedipus]|uniref:Uncharacterized protein n=1 Tax=Saguinus oedipus TaxID=9490 RepID=A0ABQ9TQF8_SAGOE|nr:hypothetical protein P7K49_032924 [Saguinus oedipus]